MRAIFIVRGRALDLSARLGRVEDDDEMHIEEGEGDVELADSRPRVGFAP